MVVFTAKNKVTGDVFVGSARDSVEEHWARLIVLAEEGGTGELLDAIREHSADQFEVETWDYADTAAESRELIRDASEQLNAKMIKTGRVPVAPAVKAPSRKKAENDEDNAGINQADGSTETKSTETTNTETVSPIRQMSSSSRSAAADAILSKKNEALQKQVQEKRASQTEHGKVTSIDINAYLANKEAEPEETKAEPTLLRKTESTKVAEDMKSVMVRIEMQRKKNRVSKTTAAAKKAKIAKKVTQIGQAKKTTSSANQLTPTATSHTEIPPETSADIAERERKIKAAIEQERVLREAEREAEFVSEAKKMTDLLARMDERTSVKGRQRRRR